MFSGVQCYRKEEEKIANILLLTVAFQLFKNAKPKKKNKINLEMLQKIMKEIKSSFFFQQRKRGEKKLSTVKVSYQICSKN